MLFLLILGLGWIFANALCIAAGLLFSFGARVAPEVRRVDEEGRRGGVAGLVEVGGR